MSLVFARNFDAEEDQQGRSDAEPDSVSFDQLDKLLQETRQDAFEQGHRAGVAEALAQERATRAARTDNAVILLSKSLGELEQRDAALRNEIEQEMAELLVGIGERILPDLFDANLTEFLLARTRTGLRIASGTGRVEVLVAPEMRDAIAERVADISKQALSGEVRVDVVSDSSVEDGTIRVDWKSGFLEYDPIVAAMEALETLREAVDELKSKLGSPE